MSPHDAPPEMLIAAGWGDHHRVCIPSDWQTNRGPDPLFHKRGSKGPKRKRLNQAERRATYLVEAGRLGMLMEELSPRL